MVFSRELQAQHQSSLTFEQMCKNLTRLQEKLVEESTSKKPQSLSCLQEMLTVHQVQNNSHFTDMTVHFNTDMYIRVCFEFFVDKIFSSTSTDEVFICVLVGDEHVGKEILRGDGGG